MRYTKYLVALAIPYWIIITLFIIRLTGAADISAFVILLPATIIGLLLGIPIVGLAIWVSVVYFQKQYNKRFNKDGN